MSALDGDPGREQERLLARCAELEARLAESEDTLRAIRRREVDAFVVEHDDGERIYGLRTSETLYRALVEEMKEAAAVLDASGHVVYGNPHLARLLDVDRGELVGAPIALFVGTEGRSFFDYLRQAVGASVRREIALLRRDGVHVPVSASLGRIRLEDSDVFGLVMTDLRDVRRGEELLAANVRKDEFLAMLAHELRAPLAPIQNTVELMRRSGLPPAFEESRRLIERQVRHLARLLDDLLDIQRFTHGVIGLETRPVDVGAIVEAAVETLRSSASAKAHVLSVERSAEPVRVMADGTRLTQVVSNLLINAIKYSPPGGRLSVGWTRDGTSAVIRVSDEGIGMPGELLAHVFEPFVQGERDLARSQGGLGLGLALVKKLVDLHGGTVEASSDGPGKGSQFVVRLPLLADPPAQGRDVVAKAARREDGGAQRVLIVDDNEDSVLTLAALLKLAGHRVECASDGVKALDLARRFAPQVVLLDIGLPGMDGYEVGRRMRAIDGLESCLLVAVTGYGRSEDREKTRDAGFSAHLVKPVECAALLELVASPLRAAPSS